MQHACLWQNLKGSQARAPYWAAALQLALALLMQAQGNLGVHRALAAAVGPHAVLAAPEERWNAP